jgi:hypothetical protein
MGPRRDLSREISRATKALSFAPLSMTAEERDVLKAKLMHMRNMFRAQVQGREMTVTDEEIDTREEVISESPELVEVFQAFWSLVLPFTKDGILQKPFYLKLQYALNSSCRSLNLAAITSAWKMARGSRGCIFQHA